MTTTRTSKRGRNPTLRDQILMLLAKTDKAITMKEIAQELNKDETTPFRPLKDLVLMGLVETDDSDDGMEYFLNKDKYVEFTRT